MNNGFVFLRSYYDAINDFDLSSEQKGIFLDAIFQYVFEGVEPQFEKGLFKGCWTLIKPTLDNSLSRYTAAVENGKKGGAPKGNNNAKKQPKTTQEQPKNNLNKEKEKDKENEYDKEININNENEKKNKIEMSFPSVEEDELDMYITGKKHFTLNPTPSKPKNGIFDNIDI